MNVNLFIAQILNGIAIGMLYALMAFGLSIIKGLMNIPNFAHGSLYALGAYTSFATLRFTGSFLLALLVGTVTVGIVGLFIERVAIRRLSGDAYLFQLLLLFGVALILQELIILIWGGEGKTVIPPGFLAGGIDLGVTIYPKYLLFTTVVSGGLITLSWLFIEKARYGAIIRAGIEKKDMVSGLGINVEKLFTITFGLGSALAGLSGALAVPVIGLFPTVGVDMLSIAFVVVFMGGLGSLYGSVFAGLIVGLVQSLTALWLPAASTVMIYVAMALVLLLRPQGLLGER